jgi:uncharacterized membrane protein (GlpM family)
MILLVFQSLLAGLIIATISWLIRITNPKTAAVLSFIPLFTLMGVFFVANGEADQEKIVHQYLLGLLIAAPTMIIFCGLIYWLIEKKNLFQTVAISLFVWLTVSISLIIVIN